MSIENTTLNQPPKKKETQQLSRRGFLIGGAGMLATAGGLLVYKEIRDRLDIFDSLDNHSFQGFLNNNNNEAANKISNKTEEESRIGILREIKSKYGIEIPVKEGEYTQYQVCLDSNSNLKHCGDGTKSTQITTNEASIINESLAKFPSPGTYIQLIIPFRHASGDGGVGGGHMWGQNWEYFLDPAKYQEYPRDRYLSKKSASVLELIDKRPGDILPPVTDQSNFLPLLSEAYMNEVGVSPVNRVDYPWTTFGERLRQNVCHEIGGHGVIEYATKIKANHDPKVENEASAMSLFGGIPLDTNQPIISSFAKVNGWRLIPYSDYIAQCGDYGKKYSEDFKKREPENAAWPIWDRDPKVWGNLKDRKIKLDTYASYSTIKETFATFFMFYALSRVDERYDKSLLTKAETNYFERMFDGLAKNPEGYIKTLIAENPGPSYSLKLFDNEVASNNRSEKAGIMHYWQANLLKMKYTDII